MTEKLRVLSLCTRNAARSQMAEALLRHLAGERCAILSVGLEPTEVHPLTREVLQERGIPTTELRAKGVRECMGKVKVDDAIGVCDPAEMNCPRVFPFALQTLQWPFEDPAAAHGSVDQLAAFRRVRDAIDRKVRGWVRDVAVPR